MSFKLRLEALLLVLLLGGWMAGIFRLGSSGWLVSLRTEPGNSLVTGARGRVQRDGARLIVPGARDSPTIVRFAPLEIAAETRSLLVLRAAAGPGFTLQLIDREQQPERRNVRFPPRTRSETLAVVLDADDRPASPRITLWNHSRAPLELESIELRPLPAASRWLPRLFWPLAPLLLVGFCLRHRYQLSGYLRSTEIAETSTWDALFAALVFLLCFLVFRAAPVHQLLDAKYLTAVSHSLLRHGSLALPPDFVPARRVHEIYALQRVGEKTYHFFSDAPAILNAPFVAAFELAGVSPVGADGSFLRHQELRILRFIAAFLAAALCTVLFGLARQWLPPPHALALVGLFAFGTQIFSTLSRPYWSHTWAVLLLALAIHLLTSRRLRDRLWPHLVASTLLCWAYFCRPPMSLTIVAVCCFLLATRRRYLLWFLAVGALWAALFVGYSLHTFGSPLPPYFLSSHLASGRLAGGILLTSYPKALVGTLLSPGRGLFVYVPLYALILTAVIRYWRRLPERALAVTALAVCCAHWQLVSLFRNWWGGQSFGPRLMSDLVPWFFVLAVMALAAVRSARRHGAARWGPFKLAVIVLVLAAAVFINTRGATAQETMRGAGIWNWRYPQFMAGLMPRPGVDSRD